MAWVVTKIMLEASQDERGAQCGSAKYGKTDGKPILDAFQHELVTCTASFVYPEQTMLTIACKVCDQAQRQHRAFWSTKAQV